jgi:thymidylate synthase
MYTFGHFTEAYYALLEDVYKRPQFVSAPRGLKIYETLGYQFKITDPRDRIPFFAARKFKPEYVAAEALWYFAGLNSTAWIANYSKFWNKISDDGATANSAYGARIFKPHDRIGGTVDPKQT